MSEEELAELTYAFQAVDMDGGGAIDAAEFGMMLAVMGCALGAPKVAAIMAEAKAGFKAWKLLADGANAAKCRQVWEQHDADRSGTLDAKEVAAVMAQLRQQGARVEGAPDLGGGGELGFERFCAWFIAHEGLPDDGGGGSGGVRGGGSGRCCCGGAGGKNLTRAMAPFRATTRVVSAPAQLLAASAQLLRSKKKPGQAAADEAAAAEARTLAKMQDGGELIFAEYAHMMRAGALRPHLPADWRARAGEMRKLREAFDAADVDGDNRLELAELEMCILSMNPKADIQPADIRRVWAVLNPAGKEWIAYGEFVRGMLLVKADPALARAVPLDVPNRFMLLSLLIDTPINEEQEALIYGKMAGLEKWGVKLLEKMRRPKMERLEIQKMLGQACTGQLHYLTEEQRTRVGRLHRSCVLQACLIAMVFTGLPGLWENFLVYTYETDGAVDAYWTCAATVGDPSAPPWEGNAPSGTGNLTLQHCPYGLCTSIPPNATEFLAIRAAGGAWDDGDGPCPLVGACDARGMGCTPLLKTVLTRDGGLREGGEGAVLAFWVLNVAGIVLGIAFELSLLMYTALRSAVKVSAAIDLRLTPLNADRAKVAGMLIRTVFELPDPEDDSLGIDAAKEAGAAGRSKFWDVVSRIYP
jgi:Ca2+-binding EF-hand superfamily protein